jgi:hypothetical protein
MGSFFQRSNQPPRNPEKSTNLSPLHLPGRPDLAAAFRSRPSTHPNGFVFSAVQPTSQGIRRNRRIRHLTTCRSDQILWRHPVPVPRLSPHEFVLSPFQPTSQGIRKNRRICHLSTCRSGQICGDIPFRSLDSPKMGSFFHRSNQPPREFGKIDESVTSPPAVPTQILWRHPVPVARPAQMGSFFHRSNQPPRNSEKSTNLSPPCRRSPTL